MRNVACGWACAVAALGGCGEVVPKQDAGVDAFTPDPTFKEVALIPGTINRDVDLLFIIDDSPSMLDKQTNLKSSFPAFTQALASGGTLPSLHIGVVSTDMGTLGTDDTTFGPGIGSGPGSCTNVGKDGALQSNMSAVVSGSWIIDANGTKNYSGTLESAFSSIASAGATGCGFEQPLHAMARAISNAANAGFFRDQARLGVIVLADEDDCSIAHSTMLGPDTGTLGPLQSFRCSRFGVTCDVGGTTADEMNMLGVKTGCRASEQSPYMSDLSRYKTVLESVKDDPRDVLFAAIVGDPGKVEVEDRTPPGGGTAIRALKHACTYTGASSQMEVADPGVRLGQLANLVRRGSIANICTANLGGEMSLIAQRIKGLVGEPCIDRVIALPARCQVFDTYAAGGDFPIPACSETSGSPCFSVVSDATLCPAAQNLKVDVMRDAPVATDTWTSVRCAL